MVLQVLSWLLGDLDKLIKGKDLNEAPIWLSNTKYPSWSCSRRCPTCRRCTRENRRVMRHATCPYSSVHLLHLGHLLQGVSTTGPGLLRLLRFGDKSCGNPSSLCPNPKVRAPLVGPRLLNRMVWIFNTEVNVTIVENLWELYKKFKSEKTFKCAHLVIHCFLKVVVRI